jgi:putative ABC transport system permease protein
MFGNNVKLALHAIRTARWRSILTMFGIIIGVVSVVTTVSLGQGVKTQISKQINALGHDVITIRPGQAINRDSQGAITSINFISGLGNNTFTDDDLKTIQTTTNVNEVVPMTIINGTVTKDNDTFKQGVTIATTSGFPEIVKQNIEYGEFFHPGDEDKNVAVIGQRVAHDLFKENVPIGKTFTFRHQDFIVRGVFENFSSNPLIPGVDFNSAIFIPSITGKTLTNNSAQIFQVYVKPNNAPQTDTVLKDLRKNLQTAHGGEDDFTILTQVETLNNTSSVLNLLTSLVAGIAAISLFVGGIGIMNIMLVSVSERMHEIGIRKAIGATNQQILREFLIEAMVLSLFGGFIGSILSLFLNVLIRIFTNLQPVITWQILVVANIVSLLVGVVFGVAPAIKAARKDPIQALRNE